MAIKTRKRKKEKKYSRKPHKYGRYSRKIYVEILNAIKTISITKLEKRKKKRFSRKSHKVFLVKYQKGGSSLQDTMVDFARKKMTELASKGGFKKLVQGLKRA